MCPGHLVNQAEPRSSTSYVLRHRKVTDGTNQGVRWTNTSLSDTETAKFYSVLAELKFFRIERNTIFSTQNKIAICVVEISFYSYFIE